jgi:hypothetical protein
VDPIITCYDPRFTECKKFTLNTNNSVFTIRSSDVRHHVLSSGSNPCAGPGKVLTLLSLLAVTVWPPPSWLGMLRYILDNTSDCIILTLVGWPCSDFKDVAQFHPLSFLVWYIYRSSADNLHSTHTSLSRNPPGFK